MPNVFRVIELSRTGVPVVRRVGTVADTEIVLSTRYNFVRMFADHETASDIFEAAGDAGISCSLHVGDAVALESSCVVEV